MDEVGRGCIAGPITVAAVILPARIRIEGVRDSKQLSPARRAQLAYTIKTRATAIGIGWASALEIDELGLTEATRHAGTRALAGLNPACDAVLLDGNFNYLAADYLCRTLVKADQLSQSVAAASIVAKVARDAYMTSLAKVLPDYGFELHKGYGTAVHREAIATFGPTTYHRHTWLRDLAPVAATSAASPTP
jgi:ribonuclease HII